VTAQRDLDRLAGAMLLEFLRRTHLSAPGALPAIVAETARAIGASDALVYLIDYEQEQLIPFQDGRERPTEPVTVEGTLHGRAFATTSVVQADGAGPGQRRLIVPLLDGTERLGTLEFTIAATDDVEDGIVLIAERFTHLVAETLVAKSAYGDAIALTRRSRPMTVSAELVRSLLPPLVFATDDLVIAGMLEPCYELGGDCFDYAVNGRVAHLAIFDAMGHGLSAAGGAAYAVAAYRSARRCGFDLLKTYAEMDEAIQRQSGERYVTALLATLDIDTGVLTLLSAGHPAPLLLRDGRFVKALETEAMTPLGVPFNVTPSEPTIVSLQPGDMVLLYTDGLPEARLPDGEFFTVERLAEFIERQAATGYAAPETLRRLRHAVLAHQRGELQDDATAMLVEWRRGSEHQLVPADVDGRAD
jgi:hypothetical protein